MKYIFALLGIVLTSCSTDGSTGKLNIQFQAGQTHLGQPSLNYKRVIQITSNSPTLEKHIKNQLAEHNNLSITSKGNFSEFQIIANINTGKSSAVNSRPKFIGRLGTEDVITKFTTNYTLTNLKGNSLISSIIENKVVNSHNIYPRLTTEVTLNKKEYIDISKQIITNIMPYINAADWATTIISHMDNSHAVITSGQESGIKLKDIFITATLPKTILQVVTFETTANGWGRAILRVVEGDIPAIGSQLVAVTN